MKDKLAKNWTITLESFVKRPVLVAPFVILAFFELLALELIYFFPREPLMYIANPIIKKYFGEAYLHYPGNLMLLPKLYYYTQMLIYIFLGVFLMSLTVKMAANIKKGLPIKTKVLLKGSLGRYFAFFGYGLLIILIMFFLKKINVLIFVKIVRPALKHLPTFILKSVPFLLQLSLFLSSIIVNTFFILTVPLIVISKKPFIKALGKSIQMGARNFFAVFAIILLPYLLHLPVLLLKSFPTLVINKTFPEINFFIAIAGTIVAVFVECFVIISICNFLLDKEAGETVIKT